MSVKPASRWASHSLFAENSTPTTLFFSHTVWSHRPHRQVRSNALLRDQHASPSAQHRNLSRRTDARALTNKRIFRIVGQTSDIERAGLSSSSRRWYSDTTKASIHSDGQAQDKSPGKLGGRTTRGGSLSLLSGLERVLIGTDRIAQREALNKALHDASISGDWSHRRKLSTPSFTREQNFLRYWGLTSVAQTYKYSSTSYDETWSADPLAGKPSHLALRVPGREFCRDFVDALRNLAKDGVLIPDNVLCAGLFGAARLTSTTSMSFFLSRLAGVQASQLRDTLTIIDRWLQHDASEEHKNSYKYNQLLQIFLGYSAHHSADAEHMAQPSMLNVVKDPARLALGTRFLDCVRAVGASQALAFVWKKHLEVQPKEPIDEMKDQDAQKLTEKFITQFLDCQPAAPSDAWSLAVLCLRNDRPLSEDVVEKLMDWPEFIKETTELPQYMLEYLKTGLERWARRIESDLGVVWDRSTKAHVPLDEDLAEFLNGKEKLLSERASVDNESISNEIPKES